MSLAPLGIGVYSTPRRRGGEGRRLFRAGGHCVRCPVGFSGVGGADLARPARA